MTRSGKLRPRIPFLRPDLPPLEDLQPDFQEIWDRGWFTNHGPFEQRLARELSHYLGARHCVLVANATVGLMLSINRLRLPDRSKAIVPSFTFPASALALEWAGLEPVFCDIDADTWQPVLEADQLDDLGSPPAVLLMCNTFGAPCDIDAWSAIATSREIPLVVDSASGLGASYRDGRLFGSTGYLEVFSMHATKTFAVGEGGLIATNDAQIAEALGRDRNFSLDANGICAGLGMNAKMSEVHAAIGCRVLTQHGAAIAWRRRLAELYRELLAPLGFVFQAGGEHSTYQCMSTLVPPGVDRDSLQDFLGACGIESRRYFSPPLHHHPQFRDRGRLGDLQVTERVAARILSLPVYRRMTEEDVREVCAAVRSAVDRT